MDYSYRQSDIKDIQNNVSIKKKLKYNLNRKTLSQLYITYIRPLLEYASDVWNGCNVADTEKLEKVQLEAARTVTGLTVLSSKESLYFETGWEPLIDRRQRSKLVTMYKIHNELAPKYLLDIMTEQRFDISRYRTRNSHNYDLFDCRLELCKKSFIPSVIQSWNNLSIETRSSASVKSFKDAITQMTNSVPKYFDYGVRYLNIIQTRIRHNCSALKADLYRVNICDNPYCECGMNEDAFHYFFICEKYENQRREMFASLLNLPILTGLNLQLLLWGDVYLPTDINEFVFRIVHKYIKDSKIFS